MSDEIEKHGQGGDEDNSCHQFSRAAQKLPGRRRRLVRPPESRERHLPCSPVHRRVGNTAFPPLIVIRQACEKNLRLISSAEKEGTSPSLLSWPRENRERGVPSFRSCPKRREERLPTSPVRGKGGKTIFPPLLVAGRTGKAAFPLFRSSGEKGTSSSLLSGALKWREGGVPCSPVGWRAGTTMFPSLRFSGKG